MRIVVFLTCLLFLSFSAAGYETGRWEEQLSNAKSDSAKVEVYNHIFGYYQYSNPDSCAYYLERGLKEFTDKKNIYGIASLTTLLGLEDGIQGRMEPAMKRYKDAMAMFTSINNRRGIATVNSGIGIIECRTGKYEESVKHLMISLNEFEAIHDTEGIVSTYIKLGVTNEESGSLDKALDYYNKAMAGVQGAMLLGTKPVLLLNNIGIVYGKKNDMHKAISYFEEALKKCDKPAFIGERISSLTNLGIAYDNIGEDQKALAYFDEGLAITKDKNLPEDYVRLLINRSSVIQKKDPAKSIEELKEALAVTQKIGQQLLQIDIYDDMTDMYVQMKDYKQAFYTFRTERKLADSVYSIRKAKEIANLQSINELERSNAKVNELEAMGAKNRMKRDIIIVVASVLAVTLLLLLFMYRRSKGLNDLLTKREQELQKSNNIKDKLFSIIGHDLRGPVSNIPQMLQLFEEDMLLSEEKKYIFDNLIEQSTASMETLDKLLFWGQSQIKGIGMEQVQFQTREYIQNSIKLIKNNAEQKQITITDKTPADTTVFADKTHFDFIIRNLVSNAIKFTYSGGMVEITAGKGEKEGTIVFAVKDNGIGVSKEKAPHIFEPFGYSALGTANEKGTSIGLMLCREFVKENGGEIWVKSEEGKGAAFYFSLKAHA